MRSGGISEEPVAAGGVFDVVGEEAGGGEEGFHPAWGGNEVATDGVGRVAVDAVDFAAAGEVDDGEEAVGLERGAEEAQGGGFVVEVGEGLEADDSVNRGGRERDVLNGFQMPAHAFSEAALPGDGDHARADVVGDDGAAG